MTHWQRVSKGTLLAAETAGNPTSNVNEGRNQPETGRNWQKEAIGWNKPIAGV